MCVFESESLLDLAVTLAMEFLIVPHREGPALPSGLLKLNLLDDLLVSRELLDKNDFNDDIIEAPLISMN